MKNNAFLYSSTPQKQNQDFVKGHNRTPLKLTKKKKTFYFHNVKLAENFKKNKKLLLLT